MKSSRIKRQTHLLSRFTFLAICISAFLLGCKDSDDVSIESSSYYPLEIGRYQVYEVAQVKYSVDVADSVTTVWQERDVVDRLIQKEGSVSTYIIARYQRSASTESWKKIKEFSVESSPDRIVQTIDSKPVVPLIFPVQQAFSWNGNMFNTDDKQDFSYISVNSASTVGSTTYDKTVVVNERNQTSIIDNYVSNKIYGLGIGLIYSEDRAFEYCQDDNCVGNYLIESGTHTIRQINSYGVVE